MSDTEDGCEMEDYDEEQDLCPECNSRDVFVRDEDAPTYGKRVCECSTCTYDWLEPAPLSRFQVEVQFDPRLEPNFARVLRDLANEIELDGVKGCIGDVPVYRRAQYKGCWTIKRNV